MCCFLALVLHIKEKVKSRPIFPEKFLGWPLTESSQWAVFCVSGDECSRWFVGRGRSGPVFPGGATGLGPAQRPRRPPLGLSAHAPRARPGRPLPRPGPCCVIWQVSPHSRRGGRDDRPHAYRHEAYIRHVRGSCRRWSSWFRLQTGSGLQSPLPTRRPQSPCYPRRSSPCHPCSTAA